MPDRPGSDELRRLVREVLREALAEHGLAARDSERVTLADGLAKVARGGEMQLTVSNDRELAELVQATAVASDNDSLAKAVASGGLRLRLDSSSRIAQAGPPPTSTSGTTPGALQQAPGGKQPAELERGVISEARVAALSKEHSKLVLGPAAVLTPLARDKARELNLAIERQRS